MIYLYSFFPFHLKKPNQEKYIKCLFIYFYPFSLFSQKVIVFVQFFLLVNTMVVKFSPWSLHFLQKAIWFFFSDTVLVRCNAYICSCQRCTTLGFSRLEGHLLGIQLVPTQHDLLLSKPSVGNSRYSSNLFRCKLQSPNWRCPRTFSIYRQKLIMCSMQATST